MKIVALIYAFAAFTVWRAPVMDPCLKEVDAIFKSMYGQLPQKGKVVYVNYEIVTTSRARSEKEEVKRIGIKTYAGEKQNRFISDEMEVYQDEEYAFTVIPSRKTIYWAQSAKAKNTDDRLTQMKKLQDTLFHHCERATCMPVTNEAGATKLVTLFPNKKWAELTQIESVEYYLNVEKKEIVKQVIRYGKYKTLKSVEYIFKETNYDYKGMNLTRPVKELFISGKSKLVAPYSGYQLIDVRKKKMP